MEGNTEAADVMFLDKLLQFKIELWEMFFGEDKGNIDQLRQRQKTIETYLNLHVKSYYFQRNPTTS